MEHYILQQLQSQGFEVKAPEGFDVSQLDAVIENAPQTEGLRKGLERTKGELGQLKETMTQAERAAEQAKREKLEAEGKFEELRQLDRQELEKLQGNLVSQRSEALKQQALSKFTQDAELVQYALAQHIKPSFENGSVVDKFEFNGNQYSNFDDYFKALSANEQFASKIKTPASASAPASGGQGSSSGAKSFKDMTATERAKLANEDPVLYSQLSKA